MGRREHVHDAAAQAPLPDLDDRVHPLVAGPLEPLEQQLAVQAVADAEPQRAVGELGGRRQLHFERRRGRDDDDGLARGEPPGDERALGVRLPLPPAPPEARLLLRELGGGGAEEREVPGEPVRVGDPGNEHERGARRRLQQLGYGQRARRPLEPGDAQTGVSLGEGFRQGVKRRPVGQHRELLRA